jgi:hypothetical protein
VWSHSQSAAEPKASKALEAEAMSTAISLTLAIGLQDIPEGMTAAFVLRNLGMSKRKAFFYGQLTGAIELLGGTVASILLVAYCECLVDIVRIIMILPPEVTYPAHPALVVVWFVIDACSPSAELGLSFLR